MGLPTDIDARKYYRVAKQRFEDAELILSELVRPSASQYLAGYAVECILKALLLVLTPSNERPKMVEALKKDNRFGHNIRGLRSELIVRGAPISRTVASAVAFAATWSPNDRYEPGPGNVQDAEQFLSAVRKIVTWADGRM